MNDDKIYKILIKSDISKNIYSYYFNPEDEIDYETTDLDELKEKYEALLEVYPKSQLKIVHELQPEFTIDISE